MTTAAVVLAAGAGTRFDGHGHKLLAPIDGVPVVQRAVAAALAAGLDETIVVVGAEAVAVRAVLPPGVTVLEHAGWAEGIAGSLAAAVRYAAEAGHEAVVVGLGDQPGIGAAAWQRVAAADAPVAVATYDGAWRNPVRLAASVWPALPTSGDEGARIIFRDHPELVTPVACEGDPHDVDTTEDLGRWS